jgi:hypothetical protein
MRLSKILSATQNRRNMIRSLIVCFFVIFTSFNVLLFTNVGLVDVSASESNNIPRGSRANNDNEPTNNNLAGAEPVTYNFPARIIDASISSGDPGDFWKIPIDYGTKKYDQGNLIGVENSIQIVVFLENVDISGGVKMKMYDADHHVLGTSIAAMPTSSLGNFTLFGQVNSDIYIEVYPVGSGGSALGDYAMTVINLTKIDLNPAFDDNNRFSTATSFNITTGKTFNDYLDYEYDNADFFTFDTYPNQKIELDLTINTAGCDFDLYVFDGTLASQIKYKSTKRIKAPNQNSVEHIEFITKSAGTYYIRAMSVIDGTWLGERGDYTLTCSGNLAPFWNNSIPTIYTVNEDNPPFDIDLEPAFHEFNTDDTIKIEIIDPSTGPGGHNTLVDFQNATVLLTKVALLPLYTLTVTPKPDKFGTETFSIQATDDYEEVYTEKNITIRIEPVNDRPILNGTNLWHNNPPIIASNDGKKLTGQEGSWFETVVTGYDPVDPFDKITFYAETEIFEINQYTGEISFLPTYHVTGTHTIRITAMDNGTAPNETYEDIDFIFKRSENYPTVDLLIPVQDSIQYTLVPEFIWEQTDDDYFNTDINYEFYLSEEKNLVENRNQNALIVTTNQTYFKLTENLQDKKTYYWTVIPNDGLHLGECDSGILSFSINMNIIKPSVNLKTPNNNQMIDTKNVLLTWELEYEGTDSVFYDVYFGGSLEDINDPSRMPSADIFIGR